jgi:hypothetical protein
MEPQWQVDEYAGWIAPPSSKIDHKPGSFEWVKLGS